MSDTSNSRDDLFATTILSLIQEARRDPAALEAVVNTYYPALRMFLQRRFRLQEHDVDDLLHDFLKKKKWLKDIVDAADPARGKFRQLLAKSLANFVRDAFRKTKTGGGLPAELPGYDLADERESDQDSLDVSWAEALVGDAFKELYHTCREQRPMWKIWNVFKARYLETEPWTGDRIAQAFGLRKGQVDAAARDGRQAFRELTLRRLAEQAAGAVDDEALVELRQAIRKHDRCGGWRQTAEPYLLDEPVAEAPVGQPAEAEPRFEALLVEAETEEQMLRATLTLSLRQLGVPAQGTLHECLTGSGATVESLLQIKEVAKQRREQADRADTKTQEVWTWVYVATLAVALARHGVRLADKSDEELRNNLRWAQKYGWGSLALAQTFTLALDRVSETP